MNYRKDWKSNKGSKLNEPGDLDYYNLPNNNVTPTINDITFEYKIKRIIEYEFRTAKKVKTTKNSWHKWVKT